MGYLLTFRKSHLWALLIKEFRQTLRNRLLLYWLLIPPIVQLIILGAALDPILHHLPLGICDESNSLLSRQFKDTFEAAQVFQIRQAPADPATMAKLLERGAISAMVLIPPDFSDRLASGKKAQVQTLVDGGDAYTARYAAGDLTQVMRHFNPEGAGRPLPIRAETTILYNPGLKSSWYLVPGILGSVLSLVGTLVSSTVLLREKETGTLEQLIMTPASAWEIILAKIAPIFILLMGDVVLALMLSVFFFGLPLSGNPPIFLAGSGLYISSCIGAGLLLATVCSSQRQAQLCSFFLNIPLIQLSGSVVPFESMPAALQQLAVLDPLRYFAVFARAALLKGGGVELLWPYLLILALFAGVLLGASTSRFRRQLA